jgi:hypothetical protein
VFGRRRSAGDRDRERAGQVTEAEEAIRDTGAGDAPDPVSGPWDVTEPHPELPRVDLGSLQVPVLEGTDIQLVFAEQHGAWVTVRHQLSELQLQAFAAPKRSGLWDEVRGEIGAEINGAGGQSVEREGPFGTELLAHVPAEPGQPASGLRAVRFTGVDGPRWFLRGLFAGAAADDPQAAAPLEAVFREVVVVRGEGPIPPRDMLELRLPAEAAAAMEEQARAQQEQAQQQQEEEQNRFSTAPNPFQRGPEMTETRLVPGQPAEGSSPPVESTEGDGPGLVGREEPLKLVFDVLRGDEEQLVARLQRIL